MKDNLRKVNRRIYWITLLNPIVIILFYKFMEYLSALCMYGGIRRRVPMIAGYGLILLIWFVIWTFVYHKKIKFSEFNFSKTFFRIILSIELIVLVTITGIFGTRIVESGMKYNGKLSWKIDEWTRSKKITLEHNNIYENGIEGIFEDLETKLDYQMNYILLTSFQ